MKKLRTYSIVGTREVEVEYYAVVEVEAEDETEALYLAEQELRDLPAYKWESDSYISQITQYDHLDLEVESIEPSFEDEPDEPDEFVGTENHPDQITMDFEKT